ncbi:hypothetical protein [Alkalicoccobacillus murimartini]|uniref:Integral membrane protein n=1 Tax=Alkalicoccobacillus murimartini TaxID=171685 RepID=A0ABT9YE70_9BACI|nr:hypothetical protein [Alkalicoccobacillus murimartini]MDQ0206153.1 hypothetical protein [Alkalicoccobacillus murimartini]
MVELTLAHWVYLAGTVLIILTMLVRQNVLVPSLLMTFVVGWMYMGSFAEGLQTIFSASLVAAAELFNIFLIITVMTALLHSLQALQADERMVRPFGYVMKTGHSSFWVLALITYGISLFFWPTPAVPLVGAILIPVAIKAGLPPMATGVAIAIAGQGMALSSDYMIKIAPMLSATAAGVEVSSVADKALVLSLITGITALLLAYVRLRKTIRKPSIRHWHTWAKINSTEKVRASRLQSEKEATSSLVFAIVVPLAFLAIVAYMVYATLTEGASLECGAGAALIGGVAVLLMITASVVFNWRQSLNQVSDHLVEGFTFAFRAMGPVIPIAGFFFLGSGEISAKIFALDQGVQAPSFLFELVEAGQHYIPENPFFAGFGLLIVGMVTGLDGSGFSGLPLVGALSGALAPTVGVDAATLAAIGQMGAVWVGGGTLIAWSSIVAVAGFAKVSVIELVRQCFIPVITGLILSTIVAILLF